MIGLVRGPVQPLWWAGAAYRIRLWGPLQGAVSAAMPLETATYGRIRLRLGVRLGVRAEPDHVLKQPATVCQLGRAYRHWGPTQPGPTRW